MHITDQQQRQQTYISCTCNTDENEDNLILVQKVFKSQYITENELRVVYTFYLITLCQLSMITITVVETSSSLFIPSTTFSHRTQLHKDVHFWPSFRQAHLPPLHELVLLAQLVVLSTDFGDAGPSIHVTLMSSPLYQSTHRVLSYQYQH